MKFELDRWEALWIALWCLILLAGAVFGLRFLTGIGIGGLVTTLLIVFFTARR